MKYEPKCKCARAHKVQCHKRMLTSWTDDPDAIEGAPSGLQVVGRPMKDEELIHVIDIVAKALGAKS